MPRLDSMFVQWPLRMGEIPGNLPGLRPYLRDAMFVVQARVYFHGCLKLHVYFHVS